jgi:hypothetical protein
MSYLSNYNGHLHSKANSGIRQARTNPAQLGYSVSIPLNRVRKHTLTDVLNINALNYPGANQDTLPENSLGTLSNFTDQATQFAGDLYNESKTFLTDRTVGNLPNYILVGGTLLLLFAFKGGQRRGKRK